MNCIVILCDTLRRDHCGAYHQGRPLNQCGSEEQPDWVVPTPNMQRLGEMGTTFDNAWCGSTPCMPARRDLYTGRFEFLERGWGPMEEEDLDLPRQVSGAPNRSLERMNREGYRISSLITDHFHLWEQGSGNYHMGYSSFEFVRGAESDAWYSDPVEFFCPPPDRLHKTERHWRNVHFIRQSEADWFSAQVFSKAAEWIDRNHEHEDFYLHIDCFDPHEPFDPPEELLKQFFPEGYDVDFEWSAAAPYAPYDGLLSERQLRFAQARYAAKCVLVDRWLGKLFEALDRHDLWKNTMVVLTADHGTFNGDHARTGKLQTHQFDACGHIPFVVYHPEAGHGERRSQLVQLVDIYPTVLSAVGRPLPEMPAGRPLHGVDLAPAVADADAPTRDYAIAGMFGKSTTITDGRWVLHQTPVESNTPLDWHGYCLPKFIHYDVGPYVDGRREVRTGTWDVPTWLSDKQTDFNELTNLADRRPDKLREMQSALKQTLKSLHAPPEQLQRLGLV